MAKYIIEGGRTLKGTVKISGNKNSVLPCLAVTLLTEKEITLTNVPEIDDVSVFLDILKTLGTKVKRSGDQVSLMTPKLTKHQLPGELTSKLRASILLVGAMLGREGKVEFSHPGGDIIGKRGIDLHLEGFKALGYRFETNDRSYKISYEKSSKNPSIFLGLPTVTGTENLILASVLGQSQVTIRNAAKEPHVIDLCHLLSIMGADIEGIGTDTLVITGVSSLGEANFRTGPDNIEFGTYAVAAAITGGEVTLTNCRGLDHEPITYFLERMGLNFEYEGDSIKVKAGKLKAIPSLITNVWPGFPTDLMSVVIVLATQCEGISLLHDWVYESRMFFVDKLISMGANITIADPHRVIVSGPSELVARNLETPDIRAGMALVLASLIAKGESTINRVELIERGYSNCVENLKNLGAKIEKA